MTEIRRLYVYENVEVVTTGRIATKSLSSGKIDQVIEITPVHQSSGSWKKWVREKDLYEIKHSSITLKGNNI